MASILVIRRALTVLTFHAMPQHQMAYVPDGNHAIAQKS